MTADDDEEEREGKIALKKRFSVKYDYKSKEARESEIFHQW